MCILVMKGTDEDPSLFKNRLKNYPMSLVLVILPCFPGLIFVGIMLVFHTWLIYKDMTTREVLD